MQPEDITPAPAISQADLNKRIERSRTEVVAEPTAPQEKMAAAPASKASVTISGQISGRKRVRAALSLVSGLGGQAGCERNRSGQVVRCGRRLGPREPDD